MSYVPNRSIPVVVQTRDAVENVAGLRHATGGIEFAGQPTDASKLTILDGTFEFDTNGAVTAGNVLVAIGVDAEETRDNLLAAIAATFLYRGQLPPLITAKAVGTDTITLKYWEPGRAGNDAMTLTEAETNVLISGLDGGRDGGETETTPIPINTAAVDETELVEAQAGRIVRVRSMSLIPDVTLGTQVINFLSGEATEIYGPLSFGEGLAKGIVISVPRLDCIMETARGEALSINQAAAQQTGGSLSYVVDID